MIHPTNIAHRKLPDMPITDQIWASLKRGDIAATSKLSQQAFIEYQHDVLSMYNHIEIHDGDHILRYYE